MALMTQSAHAVEAIPDEGDRPSLLREVLHEADKAQTAGFMAQAEALIERAYELLDAILAPLH